MNHRSDFSTDAAMSLRVAELRVRWRALDGRRRWACWALAAVSLALCTGCHKKRRGPASPAPVQPAAAASRPGDARPVPPPLPANPVPSVKETGNAYGDRFLELWTELHQLSNGYFSPEGIPYHAVETLLVEAPDYGHETTSEAYSYWVWLEAMYGKLTGDFSFVDRAWNSLEYYMIPGPLDQPTSRAYQPGRPATYAEEADQPSNYPTKLDGSIPIGHDPIADELKQAYGTSDIYGMHWLMDVDNWYGFGKRGDGTSRAVLFNTFQRGPQESVWETIPQPCWEDFKFGGKYGYLDLFIRQTGYAKQWKYTNAPDADARAVQAVYWAKRWADEAGGNTSVTAVAKKAAKMGDFVRYSFFDKYFKPIGCRDPKCAPAQNYESAHYLISWYYAWGGSYPQGGGWAWRIGSSHNHSGYQNPMAAYALAHDAAFKPLSPNGARDWEVSLGRQLEFYRWLQSSEGPIAGGATNSWNGRYETPPAGSKTFYGMAYDEKPVFHDPPSNEWMGFQVWSLQRVAEYYYVTGDERAKVILDRWVNWAKKNTKLEANGSYKVPVSFAWSGQPALDWNAKTQHFNGKDAGYNSTLHVKVTATTDDVGVTSGLAHLLAFYAKKANDKDAQKLARELLDRMWKKFRDELGVANPEPHKDFTRFKDKVYVPPGWKGKMPNGDPIDETATFLSLRSKYRHDPEFPKVKAYLDGGPVPTLTYHRFWAQAHLALAYGTYGWLFPETK